MHILAVCSILLHIIVGISANSDGKATETENTEGLKSYSGWQVVRVMAPTLNSLRRQLMPHLEQEPDVEVLNVLAREDGYDVDLLVKPNVSPRKFLPRGFKTDLAGQRFDNPTLPGWAHLYKDLGPELRGEKIASEGDEFGWSSFFPYADIQNFLKSLSDKYPSVELLDIGKSIENRTINAVIISDSPNKWLNRFRRKFRKGKRDEGRSVRLIDDNDNDQDLEVGVEVDEQDQGSEREGRSRKNKKKNKNKAANRKRNEKPIIFIEAGIHAREWISPAVATYLAAQLAEAGSSLLKHATWIIVPVANPDGYEATHNGLRMWRKNRRVTGNPSCPGVDLNRNWDQSFGKKGTSKNFCSEVYHGTSAFSEPETQAVRDLTLLYKNNIKLYLSLHCYGSVILYPWSYTYDKTPDDKDLKKFANVMAKNLNDNGERKYRVQQSSAMYPAAGVSDDWVYAQGIPYAYTIELPDRGREGFLTKAENILPISNQVWDGLRCQMDYFLGTKLC